MRTLTSIIVAAIACSALAETFPHSTTTDEPTTAVVDIWTTQEDTTISPPTTSEKYPDLLTILHQRQANVSTRILLAWEAMPEAEKTAIKQRAESLSNRGVMRINPAGDTIWEVNALAGIDKDLVERDMLITTLEELNSILPADGNADIPAGKKKRQAYKTAAYPTNIWGTEPIPYEFDSSLSRSNITKAIEFWESTTCIRFAENAAGASRIRFIRGTGCWSLVGKLGVVQEISIGNGCEFVGVAAHEIAHALGFVHEQSRVDRDDYVTINFDNIQASAAYAYEKESPATNYNYELPFDYGSVMQYNAYAFAVNENVPTMIAKEAGYQNTMGGQILPSFYDVLMMNTHYQCYSRCPTPLTCLNGGVVDVNNCSKCFCPQGYGGNLCETRGVGEKKVHIHITKIGSTYTCLHGCTYSGVEFYLKADKKNSGYRYCCPVDAGESITSETSVMPVHLYSRYAVLIVQIEFYAV